MLNYHSKIFSKNYEKIILYKHHNESAPDPWYNPRGAQARFTVGKLSLGSVREAGTF